MIHELDSCLPFEVVREKEFAPIKNATGVDSVESARELLKKNGVAILVIFCCMLLISTVQLAEDAL